jgi:hypothetical protein
MLQNPWRTRIFLQDFLPLGCLHWLKSRVYPPRSPGKGPLPGATHRASGPWSSHEAGLPLPVGGLPLMRVPTCYLECGFIPSEINRSLSFIYSGDILC